MNNLKISVITPVKNGAQTLVRCLNSVQNQDYANWEHIIVDGCSTDGTTDLLQRPEWKNMRWISEPDCGIYDAMNKGVALATGDIVAILNADDAYLPRAFSLVVAALASKEGWATFGDVYKDGDKTILAHCDPKSFLSQDPLLQMPVPHISIFAPRNWYLSWGNFDLKYKLAADFELLCRWKTHTNNFLYLSQPLGVAYPGGATSKNGTSQVLKEFREIASHYGASWYHVQWTYFSYRIKWMILHRTPSWMVGKYLKWKTTINLKAKNNGLISRSI